MLRLFRRPTVKATTVFRQLILNVVIPVVLALLILATINYLQTKNILIKSNNVKNYIITDEVKHIMELQDLALDILETRMDEKMEKYSYDLIETTFVNTDSIKQIDLYAVREKIGMNPEMDDIYIINKEGFVVNTTFYKDLDKNFFDFGEDHKNLLLNVFNSGKFVSERFAIEAATKRLKKYTYQTTSDGKYIVEIGSYSEKADGIIQFIQNTLVNISSKEADLISVDLFIGEENPFTLNKDAILIPEHRVVLLERFQSKDTSTIIENKDGEKINYEYIFVERENTDLYKGAVIRIVSDRSNDSKLLTRKLLTAIAIFSLTILSVILIIYYKTRIITKPIKKLVDNVNRIAKGQLEDRAEVEGNNEITKLSEHFNNMLERIEEYYNELEDKVEERTAEVVKQKEEIEVQRDSLADKNQRLEVAYMKIEEQNNHITDSIKYAKRIQTAILPPDKYIKKLLPQSFVLYKPKDIVSGDFYWINEKDGTILFSAVDCTGHGVPGAFMSIVGNDQLNYAVNVRGAETPAEVLMALNKGVTNSLQRDVSDGEMSVKDGMDLAICSINYKNKKLQFAGAFNPLYIIQDDEVNVIKGDKYAVGSFSTGEDIDYQNHVIDLKEGDTFYIFSDGYPDQFGGPKNKKYLYKRFREFLLSIHKKPMDEQKELLDKNLAEWMGDNEQVDDIIIIGVKI